MPQVASISLSVMLVVIITVTYYYLFQRFRPKRRCSSAAAPLPPGPQPWPVVGNLPEMMLNKPTFRWIHLVMKEMGTDIACFRFGSVHVISVACPKIAREVFKTQDANFASRPLTFASSAAGGGYKEAVLSPVGDQWRKMRRVLVSDVVSPSRHRWLHDKRADEADHFTRYLYNKVTGGAAVDVRHVARHFTGNTIRRLLIGSRYLGEPQPDGGPGRMELEQIDATFAVIGSLFSFCVSDYLPWLVGFDVDGHEKIAKEANATMDRLQDTVIHERWRQWKTGEKEEVEDLLDVLVTHKDGDGNVNPLLTIDEVKAQTKIIILAAVDNPSNAVEWALAEMVNNPELLATAVEEMDRVVGRERLVQETDIPRLNYAKACLREAFRLHPVDPFNLPHVALADTTVAGYRVPKGSHVLISRIGLGRNPTVWDEPHRFKPERHMGDGIKVALTESEMRFISFGTGRRGCVATSLGTAMTVMLFGRLLQGFTWSKPSEVTSIDLSESKKNLYMAKPLVLHAEPRLPVHLYNLQP
ncbi:tyrosine N-monooxygenase-like [Lolium rigidum]|uniref:tyrosine N-monooxygenase-like n=1 Tax=Lolium rigidum TaxID=89674 RepID=UPI001F5C281A|nr:tyrosine N-monooxygenase-like [Lolium rigidum]